MSWIIDYHNITETGRSDAPPMLFANGFACDQTVWRFVAPHFEDRYRVIRFDYVGAGKAQRPFVRERYEKLKGYAADLVEIVEELDLRDIVFVGHSVSCMIGIMAAQLLPGRFAKTILVGPSPRYVNDGTYRGGFSREDIQALLDQLSSNYLGWSSTLAPIVAGAPDQPEVAEELYNSFCRMSPEIAAAFAQATFLGDNREDLARHDVPSLILQCTRDNIADRWVGTYTCEQIAGSKIIYMKARGHCPHLSGPAETIAAIDSFL